MAQFSESDIDAARRRVQEMRNRATKYTESTNEITSDNAPATEENIEDDILEAADDTNDNKSFIIILALIFLLSKEGADNKLILALLYLLL